MNQIIYRSIQESEIEEATALFIRSVTDLMQRNKLPVPPFTVENRLPLYEHIFRTGQFEIAEQDGKIVAIANGLLRGDVWFLSGFWALPEIQKNKIGKPLLQRIWKKAQNLGARTAFTWSSIDFAAIGSYLKMGMMPITQLLTFSGKPDISSFSKSSTDANFKLQPIQGNFVHDLDKKIRGATREVDHAFWYENGAQGYQIHLEAGAVGYFYIQNGVIGPVAWSEQKYATGILKTVLDQAANSSNEVRITIPGSCHEAIQMALANDLKLTAMAHLMATACFGLHNQYLPSGPLLY